MFIEICRSNFKVYKRKKKFKMEFNSTVTFEEKNLNVTFTTATETMATLNFTALLVVPIIALVAMGNVLVIVAVALEKNLRSATNCFLSSLAVADLLVALTVMPPSLAMIINNYEWPFNDDFCGAWVMLDVLFSTSSILHLCMLSFDRYMALARPFHHRRSRVSAVSAKLGILSQNKPEALKRVARRITFVWTVAFGIALPIPIIGKTNRSNLFYEKMCTINVAEFQIYGSLAAFFMPLVFMFVMYTLTIKTLRQQANMVSNLLVYNGRKTSPTSTQNKSNPFRRISAQLGPEKPPKCVYTGRQFQRRASTAAIEETEPTSPSTSSSAQFSPMLMAKMKRCAYCSSEIDRSRSNYSWWSTPFRPLVKTVRRWKIFACFGRSRNEYKYTRRGSVIKDRCTCAFQKEIIEVRDRRRSSVRSASRFQRNYRSSVRRISSSFKNKAMTSITTEQRASKVLGLIFVLFCLFWCPFFFTNVLSRLCLHCDQDLIGELMKWFVWVGYVSSGVNPCVYTLFSRRFRRTFYLLIRCRISCIKRPRNHLGVSRQDSTMSSIRSNTKRFKTTTTTAALLKDREEARELESLSSPIHETVDRDFEVYENSMSPIATAQQITYQSESSLPSTCVNKIQTKQSKQFHRYNDLKYSNTRKQTKRYRRNNSVEEFLQKSKFLRSIVQDLSQKTGEETSGLAQKRLLNNECLPNDNDDNLSRSSDSVCWFVEPNNSLSSRDSYNGKLSCGLDEKELHQSLTRKCFNRITNISRSSSFERFRLKSVSNPERTKATEWEKQPFFGLRRQSF